jgi:hypothetical protein
MYFWTNPLHYNELFDYPSNQTLSQVEQDNDHPSKKGQWVLIK